MTRVAWIILLLAAPSSTEGAPDRRALAESAIKRLSPSAFPQLPRAIETYLERRECTIPQSFVRAQPHNVVSGNFFGRGRTDWAVVCSRAGESKILVFAHGRSRPSAELSAAHDESYLQEIGGGRIGYSRIISTVGRTYVLEHYRAYGGRKPPPPNHQGIDDAFAEKASIIRYFQKGKWLDLTGAD